MIVDTIKKKLFKGADAGAPLPPSNSEGELSAPRPVTERKTWRPVHLWIYPNESRADRPQWIGDRLRAIAGRRDHHTISDRMMILRNTTPETRVCRWEPGDEVTGLRGRWVPSKTLGQHEADFARMGINERPMNRAMRNSLMRGWTKTVKPPALLAQDAASVERRKEVRRLTRNWMKADKRRRANNSKSN